MKFTEEVKIVNLALAGGVDSRVHIMALMGTADGLFFVACFTIVMVMLASLRDRLKRIEENLNKMQQ